MTNKAQGSGAPARPTKKSAVGDSGSDLDALLPPFRGDELAASLMRATEMLNERLAQVEKGLVELQLGVSASVLLETPNVGPTHLWFRKQADSWGLFIDQHGEKPISVKHASRELRVRSANSIGKLVLAIMEASAKELGLIQGGIRKLDDALSQLRALGLPKEAAQVAQPHAAETQGVEPPFDDYGDTSASSTSDDDIPF
jgi:hypothetical protein